MLIIIFGVKFLRATVQHAVQQIKGAMPWVFVRFWLKATKHLFLLHEMLLVYQTVPKGGY